MPQELSGYNTPAQSNVASTPVAEAPAEPQSENIEDDEEISDDIPGRAKEHDGRESASSRSSRGLRVLSVRVRELVFEKRVTTYKEVADELIKELVDEGKMTHDTHNVIFILRNIYKNRVRTKRMLGEEYMTR